MKAKELSSAFGIKTSELSHMLGVSRQAFYDFCTGKYMSPVRIKALRYISIEMYEKSIEQAKKAKAARDAALDQLEQMHRKENFNG